MRILVLGINYAPERTGIAPYTTGLVRHLSKSHNVTVLTGVPHYPDWVVPAEYRRWRSHGCDNGARVIRLKHYVPRKPTAVKRAAYELSWAAHATAVGLSIPCDFVLAVVPALFAAHAAAIIARRHKAKFGVHVQDVMSVAARQSGVRGGKTVAGITAHLEKSGLSAANAITTIHPRLAQEISRIAQAPNKPTVIYNWSHVAPSTQDATVTRRMLGWAEGEVIVLHSGSMGAKQNLDLVISAATVAQQQNLPIRFVLAGSGPQRSHLEYRSLSLDNVSVIDSVSDRDYPAMLEAADYLLISEKPSVVDMCLPSKLTSYLMARKPVLAATSANSATSEFIRSTGSGVVLSPHDPRQLIDTIMRLEGNPHIADHLARAGRCFAEANLSPVRALQAYDDWLLTVSHDK